MLHGCEDVAEGRATAQFLPGDREARSSSVCASTARRFPVHAVTSRTWARIIARRCLEWRVMDASSQWSPSGDIIRSRHSATLGAVCADLPDQCGVAPVLSATQHAQRFAITAPRRFISRQCWHIRSHRRRQAERRHRRDNLPERQRALHKADSALWRVCGTAIRHPRSR